MSLGGLRYWSILLALGATALLLESRADFEKLPPRKPIADFPIQVGEWQGRAIQIQADILEILGDGEFASRVLSRKPDEPAVDFFLAYFASQRAGDTLHSPQNCLPGAGWSPLENSRVPLHVGAGQTITVNRYIIGRGMDRQVVLYWYQAHGRAVASEYAAKVYLVADAIRLNRTDGALIRIVTPVGRSESIENAEARAREFALRLAPMLPGYIPE